MDSEKQGKRKSEKGRGPTAKDVELRSRGPRARFQGKRKAEVQKRKA
jgi:hypothetical protein